MKVMIVQNRVYPELTETLDHLSELIARISEPVDVLVFGEMFTTPYDYDSIRRARARDSGKVATFLGSLARKHKAYVVGGSFPESVGALTYNTCLIIAPDGGTIAKYRKMHLFEITYPDGRTFGENRVLTPGKEIVVFPTAFGPMGVMICFDIRFPRLADLIAEAGARVIFVPAAFNTFTGPLHWHITFRARATDNQLFMIGASPSRNSAGGYEPYGHSLACDPFGRIIGELGENEDVLIVDLDLGAIEQARAAIPIRRNRIDL